MSAKATLGYASRTEAVFALRAQGCSTSAIAHRIGIAASTVTALEVSALRHSTKKPERLEDGRAFLLPADILSKLRRPAAKRKMSANELARRIVEQVVDDGIIDAVLDDAGGVGDDIVIGSR